jgi:hypothetical protein
VVGGGGGGGGPPPTPAECVMCVSICIHPHVQKHHGWCWLKFTYAKHRDPVDGCSMYLRNVGNNGQPHSATTTAYVTCTSIPFCHQMSHRAGTQRILTATCMKHNVLLDSFALTSGRETSWYGIWRKCRQNISVKKQQTRNIRGGDVSHSPEWRM